MKIKLPKINKIELDKVINYTSLKKLSFAGAMNIECFDCGDCDVCWECDYDCNYDCDYDCDYNPYDYDCVDDCVCDCDCDCVCDCDFDPWGFGYIPKIPAKKPSASKEEIHIIGVRFVTQTRGCYYYRCKKPEYKIGDTLSVPTQYGNKESRVVFVRTYKDINEYSKDITYALDSLKWAPEKKTLSPEEIKKAEQERIAKEKAKKERIERERAEKLRKEEEERQREEERRRQEEARRKEAERKKRIQEEKEKIQNYLKEYTQGLKKDDYSDVNWNKLNNLICSYIQKLNIETYLNYKEEYAILMFTIKQIKTLEQEEQFKKNIKIGIISFATLIFVIVMLLLTINVFIPNARYSTAMEYIENGQYEKAEEILNELDDFKDSKKQIKLISIRESFDSRNYSQAIEKFKKMNGKIEFIYDYRGGTKSNKTTSFCGENVYSCEKQGYKFNKYVVTNCDIDTSNMTLYIHAEATYYLIPYNIKYHLDGGNNSSNNPEQYTVESNDIVLKAATKDGYDFIGWSTSLTSKPKLDVCINTNSGGDLEFYANWKAKKYTIKFDSNGGNYVDDLEVVFGSSYLLPNVTKQGYVFKGWYNGNELVSNDIWNYTSDLNLKAKWTLNEYSITYYLNGGTTNNPTSYNIFTDSFKLEPPTKTGYKFIGWSDSQYGEKKLDVTINKGNVGNIVFYAHWEITVYNITYYLDGGSNGNNPNVYTVEQKIVLDDATKKGYSFDGWYADSNFKQRVTQISKGSVENIKLYAKFNVNSYNVKVIDSVFEVTFMMNDGTQNIYSKQYVTKTLGLQYPELPLRSGYCFKGWYLEKECINVYDFSCTIDCNKTLYAGWHIANQYNDVIKDGRDLQIYIQYTYASMARDGINYIFSCLNSGSIKIVFENDGSSDREIIISNLSTNKTLYNSSINWHDGVQSVNAIVNAGDVIRIYSFATSSLSGTTLRVEGITTPIDGGLAYDTSKDINVSYDSNFYIPVRSLEGYIFVGYFDANGVQYTDEDGNSLDVYKEEQDVILYEKWEKLS